MTDDTIQVRTDQGSGALIVSPEGEVDLTRSPALLEALRDAQRKKPQRLVVDLARVDYMDSSGVATLVESLKQSRRQNLTLVLCGMNERVRSIFEIARLDSVFTIVDDVNAALEA